MPRENLFRYDIAAVQQCAQELLAAIERLCIMPKENSYACTNFFLLLVLSL